MTALLAGGGQGLVLLQEQPYGWEVWERTDAPWAGRRVWALARAPGAILAGTDAGLLRSTDRGLSWETTLPGDVRAILAHPARPGRLFAGTQPAAVWRSDDGSAGWRELTGLGTPEERAGWHLPGATPLETVPLARVGALASPPGAPETIYAGVEVGGVWRSDDGGAEWRACNAGPAGLAVHQLVVHPLAPETLYIATDAGVYRSADGGARWDDLMVGAGVAYTRAILTLPAAGPGEPVAILAGPAEVDPWGWAEEPDGARCRLYRSTDGGERWRHVTSGLPPFFAGPIGALAADPDDADIAWLGSWDGRIFMTRDRGLNWTQIAEELGEIWALCPLGE